MMGFWKKITSRFIKSYSKLVLISDKANWVLDWEIKEIKTIANQLGIKAVISAAPTCFKQSIFFSTKYYLMKHEKFFKNENKIGLAYFHGYPTSGEKIAQQCYAKLKEIHSRIDRVQVSHSKMRDYILETGISKDKVFLIPIGVNTKYFKVQSEDSKNLYKKRFGIPKDAIVIGSFQKDGNGWQEGISPKLIKGPDLFIETVKIICESIPETFVLLSGPARGFVKRELEKHRIPYQHIYLEHYPDIWQLYQCLDVYIVSSREEGGPKAVLESMASGVPLATTRVGQAMDLVENGINGLMVEIGDVEALADSAITILSNHSLRKKIIRNGLTTATQNSYDSQIPMWEKLFTGFVET